MATKTKKKAYVKFQCLSCKRINYLIKRSKGMIPDVKLELKKFCKWCQTHTNHKETKK